MRITPPMLEAAVRVLMNPVPLSASPLSAPAVEQLVQQMFDAALAQRRLWWLAELTGADAREERDELRRRVEQLLHELRVCTDRMVAFSSGLVDAARTLDECPDRDELSDMHEDIKSLLTEKGVTW